jgi:hypothetical protein
MRIHRAALDAFSFCRHQGAQEMHDEANDQTRRRFLTQSALGTAAVVAAMTPTMRASVWAGGSDAPEKKEVKIGFIPLTDCASVVMASVKGFDKKYGITITPSKEASWAAVRDKLVNGELDASHVLYGLIYGVQMGIGGPEEGHGRADEPEPQRPGDHALLAAEGKGRDRRREARALIAKEKREYTFAQTFPPARTRCGSTTGSRARHQPDEGREDDHRAAAADGGQHARGQHGRLLRGRAVGRARDRRQDRLHHDHHAGPVEGPSREDARHHARIRQKNPEHRARHDRPRSSRPASGSTPRPANRKETAE